MEFLDSFVTKQEYIEETVDALARVPHNPYSFPEFTKLHYAVGRMLYLEPSMVPYGLLYDFCNLHSITYTKIDPSKYEKFIKAFNLSDNIANYVRVYSYDSMFLESEQYSTKAIELIGINPPNLKYCKDKFKELLC